MKCDLSTPYCGMCGKAAKHPLMSLLAYVQQLGAAAHRAHVERCERSGDSPPGHSVTRWADWEIALEEAINAAEKGGKP